MKLQGNITINGQLYTKGSELPWYKIYPFFLLHMLIFGLSGFFMAYFAGNKIPLGFLYLHGGIAIVVYTIFYLAIFGTDEVKWMFINAGLGLLGVYTEIGWLLSLFHKRIQDYPLSVHLVPFLYYVLYTFLLRHAILDITQAREDKEKKKHVELLYIAGSVALSAIAFFH